MGGIDGAKAQLDRALRPSGARWAVPHEARGVATRVERCLGLPPTLRGRDATGSLARLVTRARATERSVRCSTQAILSASQKW